LTHDRHGRRRRIGGGRTLRIAEILGNVDVGMGYGLPVPVWPLHPPMAVCDRAINLAGISVLAEVELSLMRAVRTLIPIESVHVRAKASGYA
jgi:hypothetical protein